MAETMLQDINNFKSTVIVWAEKIDVEPKEIHLRQMKNKWASLSNNRRLTFNAELLSKHKKFADYVIVHELLHIKVPNHGKLFKSLMHAFIPEWENLAKEIDFLE
ncbi:M48 family metallopeptidase [bacterium]|nr:M48 family metallopeptidase [bacterium]